MPIEFYLGTFIVLLVLGVVVGSWIIGLARSIRPAQAITAAKANASSEHELLSMSRGERMAALTPLPVPAHSISLFRELIEVDSLKGISLGELLDQFEMSILRSASPELFFLTLQETTRQEELNSMVVGIEVNKKTRFLAWVKASVRGDLVTCEFRCAEFRPLGQASASESHFRYGEHQHEKYKTTEDGFTSATWVLLDAVTGNFTSEDVAKEAEYFKSYLQQAWSSAVLSAQSRTVASHGATSAAILGKRPTRRD